MWLIDPDRVISEMSNDEVVIVEVESGRQSVVSGVAATVWEGMLCGHSLERIMDDVRRMHTDIPIDAERAVRAFIDIVVADGLARPGGADSSTSDPRSPASRHVTRWSNPVLERR